MQDHESTARSRELGEELRRVRELTGMNGSQLARKLGWSQSRISRLESGKRGASELDVTIFLAVCGVTGKELERLVGLCKEVYAQTWLQSHGERISDELTTLARHEATASAIHEYEPLLIPGLLQIEDYTRALFWWAKRVPTEGIEMRVRSRLARQNLLARRYPPQCVFFIHEHALRSMATTTAVMNEQLLHMSLTAVRPSCTIRVIPASAGPVGSLGGSFRLMEYPDHGPVVYVENHTNSLFLEAPQDVAYHRSLLARLTEIALDEGQSNEQLVRLANEYDVREDRYEFP